MERYHRHIVLDSVGVEGQKKLTQSRVLVVGAGGLGCPALQYLVAAGIGTIGIIDPDVVEVSNLQRQTLYGTSCLGQYKAEAAKQRLSDLNNTITIHAMKEKLTSKNALALFSDYDIIVDGTDNFDARYLINDAAILTNKPFVYGAIFKFEGQVSVFNYKNGPTYRCLFPQFPNNENAPNCSETGVLGVLPGIIGCMQANEVLKIILGFKYVLSGKLYCYNAKTTDVQMITFKKRDAELQKVLANGNHFQEQHRFLACASTQHQISVEQAFQHDNTIFIDVCEPNELPQIHGLDYIQVPLRNLSHELQNLDVTKKLMFFCKSGQRSNTAVSILQKHNIPNSFSVKGGANAIRNYLNVTTQ